MQRGRRSGARVAQSTVAVTSRRKFRAIEDGTRLISCRRFHPRPVTAMFLARNSQISPAASRHLDARDTAGKSLRSRLLRLEAVGRVFQGLPDDLPAGSSSLLLDDEIAARSRSSAMKVEPFPGAVEPVELLLDESVRPSLGHRHAPKQIRVRASWRAIPGDVPAPVNPTCGELGCARAFAGGWRRGRSGTSIHLETRTCFGDSRAITDDLTHGRQLSSKGHSPPDEN